MITHLGLFPEQGNSIFRFDEHLGSRDSYKYSMNTSWLGFLRGFGSSYVRSFHKADPSAADQAITNIAATVGHYNPTMVKSWIPERRVYKHTTKPHASGWTVNGRRPISSSSSRTDNMEFPVSLTPSIPIIHCSR